MMHRIAIPCLLALLTLPGAAEPTTGTAPSTPETAAAQKHGAAHGRIMSVSAEGFEFSSWNPGFSARQQVKIRPETRFVHQEKAERRHLKTGEPVLVAYEVQPEEKGKKEEGEGEKRKLSAVLLLHNLSGPGEKPLDIDTVRFLWGSARPFFRGRAIGGHDWPDPAKVVLLVGTVTALKPLTVTSGDRTEVFPGSIPMLIEQRKLEPGDLEPEDSVRFRTFGVIRKSVLETDLVVRGPEPEHSFRTQRRLYLRERRRPKPSE